MTDYHCRLADWAREEPQLMDIRHRVFVEEQGVPVELERDEHDATAMHFIVELDGASVATGRLKADGQIGRMAVLPQHRGRGVGSLLLDTIIRHAQKLELPALYLHSQLSATGFYTRFGFTAEGEEFLDAGIRHRAMRKNCAK